MVADGAFVDAGDGDDFRPGAGEEAFFGDVEVEAGEDFSTTGMLAVRARAMTVWRVTPTRTPDSSAGVTSCPALTMKMLSPVHSQT